MAFQHGGGSAQRRIVRRSVGGNRSEGPQVRSVGRPWIGPSTAHRARIPRELAHLMSSLAAKLVPPLPGRLCGEMPERHRTARVSPMSEGAHGSDSGRTPSSVGRIRLEVSTRLAPDLRTAPGAPPGRQLQDSGRVPPSSCIPGRDDASLFGTMHTAAQDYAHYPHMQTHMRPLLHQYFPFRTCGHACRHTHSGQMYRITGFMYRIRAILFRVWVPP